MRELPPEAAEALRDVDNSGPTSRPEYREVKGHTTNDEGGGMSVYRTSRDLRKLAAGLIMAADWLDERATAAERAAFEP